LQIDAEKSRTLLDPLEECGVTVMTTETIMKNPPQQERNDAKGWVAILSEFPKWTFKIAASLLLILMLVALGGLVVVLISIYNGATVTIADTQFGINRRPMETAGPVKSPRTQLEWEQKRYVAELVLRDSSGTPQNVIYYILLLSGFSS
jgi:hypothetical protein